MGLEAVVRRRRMVRNFTDQPVDPAVVARILDLARHAPSAGFTQGQAFVVVTDPAMRKAVADLCGEASYVRPPGAGSALALAGPRPQGTRRSGSGSRSSFSRPTCVARRPAFQG